MSAFVWSMPMLPGRRPVISHEFESGKHLGCDIMYRWRSTDPHEPPRTNRRGTFCVPDGTPVIAIGDGGTVVYAKKADNGWRTRIRYRGSLWTSFDWIDLHMTELYVKAGDVVTAGQRIGMCGGDPTDKPDHLVHDHCELRRPALHGEKADGYGTVPVDPAHFLSTCDVFQLA